MQMTIRRCLAILAALATCLSCLPSPVRAAIVNFTAKEKQEFLDAHNKFRMKADPPPAEKMHRVTWGIAEEQKAIEAAEQPFCQGEKDAVLSYPGGNLYTGNKKPTDIVKLWFNEITLFDHRQGKCVPKADACREYTQLMTAKVTKIGCARCRRQPGVGLWYIFCNYNAGNDFYEYDKSQVPDKTKPPDGQEKKGRDSYRRRTTSRGARVTVVPVLLQLLTVVSVILLRGKGL